MANQQTQRSLDQTSPISVEREQIKVPGTDIVGVIPHIRSTESSLVSGQESGNIQAFI